VRRFAADNVIPLVHFEKNDRKIDVMRPNLAAQAATGRSGVAAIGVAQEFARVFLATKHTGQTTKVWFSFTKGERRVTCYYFYVWDDDFGPTFVKVCAYSPYPVKIWIYGHEWAKRRAAKAGIGFVELSNGFASATDPAGLQAICDRFGPATIGCVRRTLVSRLPLPLTDADRATDYGWELSMRQVEVSRTLVFDAPRRARRFFEALVADNLGIGRPEAVELIFRRGQRRGRPAAGEFKTKIVTYGTEVNVNAIYRHSRIKQYLKDGRALRIETVVNDPAIWAACGACTISVSCRPAPVPSTGGCSILNVSARAPSLRVQPLSRSHSPPSPGMAAGPRPYGSATLGSKPWPAPYAPPRRLSPASPTRTCTP
jgi:hypothetical protein